MAASTFDTFKAARALEAAGVEREQAEAIASAVGAQAVTRADLEALATKADLAALSGGTRKIGSYSCETFCAREREKPARRGLESREDGG